MDTNCSYCGNSWCDGECENYCEFCGTYYCEGECRYSCPNAVIISAMENAAMMAADIVGAFPATENAKMMRKGILQSITIMKETRVLPPGLQ